MIPSTSTNSNQLDSGARALAHLSNLASFTGRVDAAQSFAASAADRAYQMASLEALANSYDPSANPAQYQHRQPDPELEQLEYLRSHDIQPGNIQDSMSYKDKVDAAYRAAYKPEPNQGYTIS